MSQASKDRANIEQAGVSMCNSSQPSSHLQVRAVAPLLPLPPPPLPPAAPLLPPLDWRTLACCALCSSACARSVSVSTCSRLPAWFAFGSHQPSATHQ